jgi:integrase
VRVHDLRHTGEVFAAEEGATVAELMERMGHSTPAAAMVYAHAAKGRSRVLADRLDQRRAAVVDIATRRQVG